MKLIKPSWEILDNPDLAKIEIAARTCYKSTVNEITRPKFIETLIKSGHESVLEHSNLIFRVGFILWIRVLLCNPKYLNLTCDNFRFIISGNVRAFRDFAKEHKFIHYLIAIVYCKYNPCFNDIIDFSKVITKLITPRVETITELHLKSDNEILIHTRKTVKFIVNRGVTHELVRHREAGFSQESTRYCNYSVNKHDNSLTFIIPCWFENRINEGSYTLEDSYWHGYMNGDIKTNAEYIWFRTCLYLEEAYLKLINAKWTPQLARDILPNALKSEIIITANLKEWKLIFEQRTSIKAHPQMIEVMGSLYNTFNQLYPNLVNVKF